MCPARVLQAQQQLEDAAAMSAGVCRMCSGPMVPGFHTTASEIGRGRRESCRPCSAALETVYSTA